MKIIEIELEDDLYENVLNSGIDVQTKFNRKLEKYINNIPNFPYINQENHFITMIRM